MVKEYLHEHMAKRSEQVSPIRVYKHPYQLKRDGLAKLFGEWGFKKGVEVGVREGAFSEVLCKYMPDLDLTCVDPWSVADYRSSMLGQEQQDKYYATCVERMKPYSAKIVRLPSMEAVRDIPDESLDFVYIDGSHEFDDVMRDIIEWSKKVRKDGIVSGHDYYRFKKAGVVQSVDLYTYMHSINEWYLTDDKTPSFFWAKP